MTEASEVLAEPWDVIVIGSGMGGGTFARKIASSGYRVLVLEKGARIDGAAEDPDLQTPEGRLRSGWWPNRISARQDGGATKRFHAPVGCAVGGSTVHYAAALERMESSDFAALATESGEIAPWPVSYSEFERYYSAAERLFGIQTSYQSEAEPRISEWDREFIAHMRRRGLRPEIIQVALRFDDSCEQCTGRICSRRCKADARSVGVDAALSFPNFKLLTQCEVNRLEADDSCVTGVVATFRGAQIKLTGRIIVLAAGALHTPQILLRSTNSAWPNGLANRSGQVGRNLMLHADQQIAVWSPRRFGRAARQRKALSIRDFYHHKGRRLGYIQSLGIDAGHGVISVYLKDVLRRLGIRNEFVLKLLVAVPARIAAAVLGQSVIFSAMTEDDPSPENRVILDGDEPDGTLIIYNMTPDLSERANALRKAFARKVAPWRVAQVSTGLFMNYGHPCGTCRFGHDPETSVLDPDCRAHDVDNLYVVDSSFMPRSSAVNPSLTIAANAIRVAEAVVSRLSRAEAVRA